MPKVIILLFSIFVFLFVSMKDLTPKMDTSNSASVELTPPVGIDQLGQKMAGLSIFSDTFKRGYGNKVFGSDQNGIWLGAADFADAPFNVDMDGNGKFTGEVQAGGVSIIDGDGLVSLSAFSYDNYHGTTEWYGGGTSGANAYDVSGYDYVTSASLSFTLEREANVMFFLHANLQQYLGATSAVKFGYVAMILDETTVLSYGVIQEKGDGVKNISDAQMVSIHAVSSVAAGDHTIKIGISTADPSNYETYIYERSLTYLVLGS